MTTSAAGDLADIITAIRTDAPFVVLLAGALLILMVLLVVGPNIRSLAVLLATGTGSVLLVAVCALCGLKVNFLDFIALPITLGLGIDYAINMAARHHDGDRADPFDTLKTSGAAVFVCSLTTIIGYGSLLTSDNLAIRGFGSASLIGEVCCVLTALVWCRQWSARPPPRRLSRPGWSRRRVSLRRSTGNCPAAPSSPRSCRRCPRS